MSPEPSRKKRRPNPKELLREVFWPRDLLPNVFPQARIITWGYGVQIEKMFASASQATIFHHAQTLLSDLAMLRSSMSSKAKPLIFLAHSLGGIIVKDALSLSQNDLTHLNEILPATKGVIFLGTPHHGSKLASLGKIAFELSRVFFQSPNVEILRGLERNSEILERITRSFGQVLAAGHLKVHSFLEELDTKGIPIVDPFSSSIGYLYETTGTLHANHRNMAKMSSLNDLNFQRVTSVIQRWLDESNDSHPKPGIPETASGLPDSLIFDEEYQSCLRSLNSADARTRIENVGKAYGKTFEWIFDPKLGFQDWLKGKDVSTKYWIQGKPGSGKSTLMKFTKDHPLTRKLLEEYHHSPWVVAAYFFHDRGIEVQKSISGFLREVLYQILRQQRRLFELIHSVFWPPHPSSTRGTRSEKSEESKLTHLDNHSNSDWKIGELQDALLSIASRSTFDVNICIFVDALDEHDGNHRDLLSTLDRLTRLTDNDSFRLRLCLAGRQENIFKDAFRNCPGFSIHELTTSDIRQYTEGRIQCAMIGNLTKDGELALSSLIENVIERAEGVFLWVRLVSDELIEGLCEGDSIEELEDLLSGIPSELEEVYTRTLRRPNRTELRAPVKSKYERYVMFQIVKCSIVPFTLYELLAASLFLTTGRGTYRDFKRLSWDQMERRLYSRSAGLLDTTRPCMSTDGDFRDLKRSRKVQFIHQTVKEYMTTGAGSSMILQDIGDEPQDSGYTFILRYLVSLLASFKESNYDDDAQKFVLDNFATHALHAEQYGNQSASRFFEPAISEHTEVQQRCILQEIIDRRILIPPVYGAANIMCGRRQAQLLYFYMFLGLHKSLVESLQLYKDDITQEEHGQLLDTAIRMFPTEDMLDTSVSVYRIRSSILEALLQADLGRCAFRSLPEAFDEAIQRLISESRIQPLAKRESISQLWTQIRGWD